MQHATRPLKLLLDRLAGARWAPLAAPVDGIVAGPDLQLAAFAPDPFASLQRDAARTETGAQPGAAPRPRRATPQAGVAARMPLLPASSSASPSPALRAAPVADVPPWRPRAAAPGLPQRARMPWPELPQARAARGVPALEATALQSLLARFAPAVDAPALDATQLRTLAASQPAPPSSPTPTDSPAAQPRAPLDAAAAPIPRRPLPERPLAASAPRAFAPEGSSLPAPQGRTSALAELLQRWPGTPSADADAPASAADVVPPSVAEVAPISSALGTPLSFAELPAAFGTELPRPQPVSSDLPFTRTLERVLLAELRRQGLEPDAT